MFLRRNGTASLSAFFAKRKSCLFCVYANVPGSCFNIDIAAAAAAYVGASALFKGKVRFKITAYRADIGGEIRFFGKNERDLARDGMEPAFGRNGLKLAQNSSAGRFYRV